MQRRDLQKTGVILAAAPAHAEPAIQTLRIGMTTSEQPTTGGIPDNGSEGGRFAGCTLYDALANWDFTNTDTFADLTPGLATECKIDPDNHLRWIFTLRENVRYHDGTVMKAEDILWNFDRHLNERAPHFDRAQALTYRPYTSQVKHYEKIDDTHVALYTEAPFSMLPYLLSRVMLDIASLRTSSLYPDPVCPSANKATLFQRSRLDLEFISKLGDRLHCAGVADPPALTVDSVLSAAEARPISSLDHL